MRYYIDEMTREHMFVLRQVHRRAWQKIIPKPQAQQEVGYTYSWHPHIITTSHAYVGVKQDHDTQSVSEKRDEEWSRSMPHTLWGIDSSLSAERRGQRYPVHETETSSITVRKLVWRMVRLKVVPLEIHRRRYRYHCSPWWWYRLYRI